MPLDFNDPTTLLIIGAGLIVLLLLLLSLRAVSRLTKAAEPLSYQINALGQRVQALGEGQERLAGGLHHVSEAQAKQIREMPSFLDPTSSSCVPFQQSDQTPLDEVNVLMTGVAVIPLDIM